METQIAQLVEVLESLFDDSKYDQIVRRWSEFLQTKSSWDSVVANPEISARALHLFGLAQLRLKSERAAAESLRMAICFAPNNQMIIFDYADLIGLSRPEHCIALYRIFMADNQLTLRLALRALRAYRICKRWDLTEDLAAHAVALAPGNFRPHLELARAYEQLGRRDEALRAYDNAIRLSDNSADIRLERSTLDYQTADYWETRYQARSERAPVPKWQEADEDWERLTARDRDYVSSVLLQFVGEKADRGFEAGCGSGRLTPAYAEFCNTLTVADISPSAIEFCKQNTKGLPIDRYILSPLDKVDYGVGTFDFVADYAVIQHVADPSEWRRVLTNYVRLVRPGGLVILCEVVKNPKKAPHLSMMGVSDYEAVARDNDLAVLSSVLLGNGHAEMVFQKPVLQA